MDISAGINDLRQRLMQSLIQEGEHAFWEGYLSSSALSTALSCLALAQSPNEKDHQQIHAGIQYLLADQNEDGGWGDTFNSPSNISTSLLVWSSLKVCATDIPEGFKATERLLVYIKGVVGSTEPDELVKHIQQKYGKDKTFAVPILMALCIGGCLGSGPDAWRKLPALPFELAALPQSLFAHLRLPVVSYALPALIAIGLVKHKHTPSRVLPMRWMRAGLERRCLKTLEHIQPENGGFLEASPLTAFVAMALSQAGLPDHEVTGKSLEFLRSSQRIDGSWPIDTNLSTWVTSLAVHALPDEDLQEQSKNIAAWYQSQQFKEVHPYTGALPGAWAWSPLPGAVPDADDTSGAINALVKLGVKDADIYKAAVEWLMKLQNKNGGMPTFCQGWGTLPFDQSCVDISAHALRAFEACRSYVDDELSEKMDRSIQRMITYLDKQQDEDGSFIPLWFGNQNVKDHKNYVLGTARVLQGLQSVSGAANTRRRAAHFLWTQQHDDGSWGASSDGKGTMEETGIVLEALSGELDLDPRRMKSLQKAAHYLCCQLELPIEAKPIGLYFASLWYSESMYPLCFALAGLRAYKNLGDKND